jgi:hypothetical protein
LRARAHTASAHARTRPPFSSGLPAKQPTLASRPRRHSAKSRCPPLCRLTSGQQDKETRERERLLDGETQRRTYARHSPSRRSLASRCRRRAACARARGHSGQSATAVVVLARGGHKTHRQQGQAAPAKVPRTALLRLPPPPPPSSPPPSAQHRRSSPVASLRAAVISDNRRAREGQTKKSSQQRAVACMMRLNTLPIARTMDDRLSLIGTFGSAQGTREVGCGGGDPLSTAIGGPWPFSLNVFQRLGLPRFEPSA